MFASAIKTRKMSGFEQTQLFHEGIEYSSGFEEPFRTTDTDSTSEETQQENETFWQNEIHRECEHADERQFAQIPDDLALPSYVSLNGDLRVRCSVWQSFLRSLRVNGCLLLVMIPLALFQIPLIYLKLNTHTLCHQWEHNNHSIPLFVMKWRLMGDEMGDIVLNLWFPITLPLLFGWIDFKLKYITTLLVGFAVGATVANYKSFLFLFSVYTTTTKLRLIGNSMFFVGIILNTILVSRKFPIRPRIHPFIAPSSVRVFMVLIVEFISASVWAWLYIYAIFPAFDDQKDALHKAIIAISLVVPGQLLPLTIYENFGMKQSSGIIQPDRSFIQVYFFYGVTTTLYRTMQADFNSIPQFIILSSILGCLKVALKATLRIQEKLWALVSERLIRICCCRTRKQQPYNTPHQRRLNADLEIQNMLFEYTSIVLSQAYLVLCIVTNYEVSPLSLKSAVINDSVVRISLGIAIDLIFNCLSTTIAMHCYDVPVQRVWRKYWKRHVAANVIIITTMVFFFTLHILTTYQTRLNDISGKYNITNCKCTPPFTF